MNKWFANDFLDLTLLVSENQTDWMRLDKYALLLGLPTDNPFIEITNQSNNFLGINNSDELLGGALEDTAHSLPISMNYSKSTNSTTVLKDALGISKSEKSSPNHIGSLLTGYSSNGGGKSLLNILNSSITNEPLHPPLMEALDQPANDTQDVLNMLTNMGINAREKPSSLPNSPSSLQSSLSSPDYKLRKASVEVHVSSPRKWAQLPDQSLENLQTLELEQQQEQRTPSPPATIHRNDWKGWAKINQPQTTRLTDIEAEQIKYVKPKQSSGWASVVGQSSQVRKVVSSSSNSTSVVAAAPPPRQRQNQQLTQNKPQPPFNQSNKGKSVSHTTQPELSKRSSEFVKWCKSECKRFGVPDPATNVITELAEKQLVVDSLLAMGVDPVDAEQFGEDFIRRVGLDEEMVVVKRRKRRN